MSRERIGPTGEFPFGQPMDEYDRGNGVMGFSRIPHRRFMALDFGTPLNFIQVLSSEAKAMATVIRERTLESFGKLSYDKSTLPIKVSINDEHHTLRLDFPKLAEVVVANPEMWLALADAIEEKLQQLPKLN